MNKRRVAITGVGIVSQPGIGVADFWKGPQTEPVPGQHHEISNWDPEQWMPRKESRRLDRFAQMALVATEYGGRLLARHLPSRRETGEDAAPPRHGSREQEHRPAGPQVEYDAVGHQTNQGLAYCKRQRQAERRTGC